MQGTNQKQKGSKTDCCSIRKHWLSIDYHQKKAGRKISTKIKNKQFRVLFFSLVSLYIYFFIPFFFCFILWFKNIKGKKCYQTKSNNSRMPILESQTHIYFLQYVIVVVIFMVDFGFSVVVVWIIKLSFIYL